MAKRYYEGSRGGERHKMEDTSRKSGKGVIEASPRGEDYFPTMSGQGRRAIEKPEMIYEDNRAIANLPQEVMIKAYPMNGPYMPEDLDDTSRGVDRQEDYDDSQRARNFFPKKV